MEIERQRGISVATSVLAFEYNGTKINILDLIDNRFIKKKKLLENQYDEYYKEIYQVHSNGLQVV